MTDEIFDIPIAIIVFRRPDLARKVVDQISKIRPRQLFVIADGPREGVPDDVSLCRETREIFDNLTWQVSVQKIYADQNLGLKSRVMSGLDQVFETVDRAIILEDDCLPSLDFFKFSRELLEKYERRSDISIISGNSYSLSRRVSNRYFPTRTIHIWGWATWSRTWKQFRSLEYDAVNFDSLGLLKSIPNSSQRRMISKLLKLAEQVDSWAVQFTIFCYRQRLFALQPEVNLVSNIGFGADSTHTKFESWVDSVPIGRIDFPLMALDYSPWRENAEQFQRLARFTIFLLLHPLSAFGRVFRFLKGRISLD